MALHATGTFQVQLEPQGSGDTAEGSSLGRMSIEKQFHGDLEGTAKGQMLTGSHGHQNLGWLCRDRASHWNAKRSQRQFCAAAPRHRHQRLARAVHHHGAGLRLRPAHRPCRPYDRSDRRRHTFLRLGIHAPRSMNGAPLDASKRLLPWLVAVAFLHGVARHHDSEHGGAGDCAALSRWRRSA